MSEGNGLKVGRIRADRGGESAFDVPHRPLDDDRRPAGQGDAGCSDVATVLKAVEHGFREATALVGAKRRLALGGLAKPLAQVTRQELSECREGHIFGDDASPTTGEAFLRWLANDVASPAYGLEVATTPHSWHGALTETVSSCSECLPLSTLQGAYLRRRMELRARGSADRA